MPPAVSGRSGARRTPRQETYQDGLLEVAIGCLLFVVALATGRPAFYWTYLVIILVLGPGLRYLKARFTYPRIGYVKFPDKGARHLGAGVLGWVVATFVGIALALALAGHLVDADAWSRASSALAGLLFAGGFVYLARQSGMIRHYALAAASAGIGVLLVWPEIPSAYGNVRVWALLMSLLTLAIGVIVLRSFVRDHPVAADRTLDDC